MRVVASRYTISIPLKAGRCLAYNSLSGGLAVWESPEREVYEQIRAGQEFPPDCDPIVSELMYGGYVVEEAVDELNILQRQYEAHRYNPRTMTLTIAPTMACNFGCDYCFQGQDKPTQSMSQAVQDGIIKMIERAVPRIKALGVAWYGGEPLLRRGIIESLSDRIIALCDAHGIKYDAMIVTNGYLLTQEAAQSLVQRRVTAAQVTLDGTPEYHDSRRYLLSKKGSFERILKNLKQVVDTVPLPISVRVNIDDRNHGDIRTLIDHMAAEGLGHRNTLKMYFAPIEAITEGCHNIQDVTLSKSQYGQLEAELYRYGYQMGVTSLPYPPRFHGTCAAVRPGGFVILPTGELHKCWDTVSSPERSIGTLFDLDALIKSDLMFRWLRWTPFVNETCRNCKLLPNCAGACAYKFVHAESTRGEAAVLPCPSWKYNIKERLLVRAVAMGAVTVDDYNLDEVRTDPSQLCADVHVAGQALPEEMQRFYDEEAKAKKNQRRHLRVLPSAPEVAP